MTERRDVLTRALTIFVPVVVAATVVIVLVFTVAQQNLRMGANDPQVQMAEDAAARLDAGDTPSAVVAPPAAGSPGHRGQTSAKPPSSSLTGMAMCSPGDPSGSSSSGKMRSRRSPCLAFS